MTTTVSTQEGSGPRSHVRSRQPLVAAIAVVAVAAVLSTLLVAVGLTGDRESETFAGNVEYAIWAALMVGLISVSAAGGVYCMPAWFLLWSHSPRSSRLISLAVAVVVTFCYDASPQLGARLILHRASSALTASVEREIALGVLVGIFTLPALSGLTLAALLLNQRNLPWDGRTSSAAITALLDMRGHVHRFLAVLAVVIGGNILAAAAFRRAMLAYVPEPPIDTTILLAYGAMMTGVLALLYVPTYVALQSRSRELLDALCPLPVQGCPPHDWFVNRSDLEGLLELKVHTGRAVTVALGLLTPFVSSLISAVTDIRAT